MDNFVSPRRSWKVFVIWRTRSINPKSCSNGFANPWTTPISPRRSSKQFFDSPKPSFMNPKPCPIGSINPRSSPKWFAKSRTSFVNPKTYLNEPIHS